MVSEIEKLLELCKYQRDKLEQLISICENCMVHMIHEEIDMEDINRQISKWEKKMYRFHKDLV